MTVTIQRVAQARQAVENMKQRADDLKLALFETDAYRAWREKEDDFLIAKAALDDIEETYRSERLTEYATTQEKKFPGGMVKVYKVYNYDTDTAKQYALDHDHPELLKLDATAFKKLAQAIDLDFVEVVEEPKATLATDLSEYLD